MTTAQITQDLAAIVATAGGGATISVLFIRNFGDKWLSSKFAENLEEFKHKQNREIEHLRYQISNLLDRNTKLNQREFEVLPEIWSKIDEAFVLTHEALSSYQQYYDTTNLTDPELIAILQKAKVSNVRTAAIMNARNPADRQYLYVQTMSAIQIDEAMTAAEQAGDALRKDSLFISPQIYTILNDFSLQVRRAIVAKISQNQNGPTETNEANIEKIRKEGAARHDEILGLLRSRFWDNDKALDSAYERLRPK